MRALGLTLLALAIAAAAAWAGWTLREQRIPPPPPPGSVASPALDTLDARLSSVRAGIERLRPPLPEEERVLRPPATPRYREHLDWADSLGVPPVSSEAALTRHLAAGRLVPLVDNEYYVVQVLTHSKPFVTPRLRDALDEAGQRFQERLAARGLPPYRLTISSALRTADLQRDLGRRNRNAAAGRSSHEYGASADIVIFRYAHGPTPQDSIRLDAADPHRLRAQRLLGDALDDIGRANWDHLWGELTRVMIEMQEERKLVVLLEAEQPVFHVTARGLRKAPPPRRSAPPASAEALELEPATADSASGDR